MVTGPAGLSAVTAQRVRDLDPAAVRELTTQIVAALEAEPAETKPAEVRSAEAGPARPEGGDRTGRGPGSPFSARWAGRRSNGAAALAFTGAVAALGTPRAANAAPREREDV